MFATQRGSAHVSSGSHTVCMSFTHYTLCTLTLHSSFILEAFSVSFMFSLFCLRAKVFFVWVIFPFVPALCSDKPSSSLLKNESFCLANQRISQGYFYSLLSFSFVNSQLNLTPTQCWAKPTATKSKSGCHKNLNRCCFLLVRKVYQQSKDSEPQTQAVLQGNQSPTFYTSLRPPMRTRKGGCLYSTNVWLQVTSVHFCFHDSKWGQEIFCWVGLMWS